MPARCGIYRREDIKVGGDGGLRSVRADCFHKFNVLPGRGILIASAAG